MRIHCLYRKYKSFSVVLCLLTMCLFFGMLFLHTLFSKTDVSLSVNENHEVDC